MCGHTGVAGQINAQHEKALRELLILDSIRGEHSTGIAAVSNAGIRIAKVVGDPFELFRSRQWTEALQPVNKVIIGHNRYATTGAVNKKNAHPFVIDNIVGAHNGTLTNKYQLLDGYTFDVDSEALYNHMEKKGLESLLKTMSGAWALVWWDARTSSLNFLRNKERSLFVASLETGGAIFWASEKWMLEVALSRNNLKIKEVSSVAEDVHFTIPIGADRAVGKPVGVPAVGTAMSAVQQKKPTYATFPQQQQRGTITNGTALSVVGATGNNNNSISTEARSQMGRKGVEFFGMIADRDSFGGEYVDCYDELFPKTSFRIYKNSYLNIESLIGESFTADVATMNTAGAEGTYFKLSAATVVLEVPAEKYFRDGNNKLLSKKEWEDKYQGCSFCTAPLVAGDPVSFTKDGDCLCEDCAKNPKC